MQVSPPPAPRSTPLAGANQPPPEDIDYPGTLEIHVDASDVRHRIVQVRERVPVAGGKTIWLLYPEWIPGHHRPSGPIKQLAGLIVRARNGKRIRWRRDPYNVYAFRVDVPDGIRCLHLEFCFAMAQRPSHGPIRMTRQTLDLSWEKVTLYPAGHHARRIPTRPSVTLPRGWRFGTALETESRQGDTLAFRPVDYLDLVDSPVYAGRHFERLDLTSDASPPVHMSIIADAARHIKVTRALRAALENIVVQTGALYRSWHFEHYEFLLALSDKLTHKGLEHSRSCEINAPADFFSDWKTTRRNDSLTHEFNHSWNGKYRRPAAHATANFNVPMDDSLLWVYEGQTQLYGNVLAVRAGLEDKATGLAKLADAAATYDLNRPGFRTWRALGDTTNDPTIAQRTPRPYRGYQGSEDYYAGGQLVWLAVDGKLRELSANERCLDDFARAFFGIHPGDRGICTYALADIHAALNGITPFDWEGFLRERLEGHCNLADGLASEGWALVYGDEPDAGHKAMEKPEKGDFTYSIGLFATPKGRLRDVRWAGPAFDAGLAPGMTIIAVNGIEFGHETLAEAIREAAGTGAPIELLVKEFNEYLRLAVDYHDGPRYPGLERIEAKPDYLSELYAAR